MGLNRNAKNLKSDDRLQREYFRRDEDKVKSFMDAHLPTRPKSNTWLVYEHMTLYFADTCMHCWDRLYRMNYDEYWAHQNTGSEYCWRKDKVTKAYRIPGVLVIEELDL